jgi:hypothetical protein
MTVSPTLPLQAATLKTYSTEALKALLLELTAGRDRETIAQKAKYVSQVLDPLFQELTHRNPTPQVRDQMPMVLGTWRSHWSTIPFQDLIPGRLHDQSYQIFADNGYYANIARYRPGHQIPLLNHWVRQWISYDFMIVQTYGVQAIAPAENPAGQTGEERWAIQNVGIKQALRFGPGELSPSMAQRWFEAAVLDNQRDRSNATTLPPARIIGATPAAKQAAMTKRYQKVLQSQPVLEHLYIDSEVRLVRSRREASQRPSYTVAVRLETQI